MILPLEERLECRRAVTGQRERKREMHATLSLYLSLAGEQGAPWTNFRYRAPQVRTPSLPLREQGCQMVYFYTKI